MMLYLAFCNLFLLLSVKVILSTARKESAARLELEYYRNCKEYLPNCVFHDITLETISHSKLVKALEPFAPDENSVESGSGITFIGLHIKEPFKDNLEVNSFFAEHPAFEMVYVHILEDHANSWGIVLRLITKDLRRALNAFASFYYPPAEICASRPISVDTDIWATWGNGFFTTPGHQGRYPEAIFTAFVPNHCSHHNRGNRWALHKECPHTFNKFECVFLPLTNCTIPKLFSECDTPYTAKEEFYYFANATAEGKEIPKNEVEAYRNAHSSTVARLQVPQVAARPYKRYSMTDMKLISNETAKAEARQDWFYLPDAGPIVYMFGIHFRPNLLFQSKVQEVIHQTRNSPFFGVWKPQDKCVVFHMRKDDRMIPGYEGKMKEWCLEHTILNPKQGEQPYKGEYRGAPLQWSTFMDFGCLSPLPYGDASLEHYFNASLTMFPKVRNFFLMTDDPNWLDDSVERVLGIKNISAPSLTRRGSPSHGHSDSSSTTTSSSSSSTFSVKDSRYKDIRIFNLASKRDRSFNQLEANVDFWASIELARQCQGVVIHPGSAVARVIALSMCYRSSGVKYLQCPDLFDMSGAV
jgi:hypothetical protein